ncbi:unnamed protein product, partial [marine sediment metagenome]
PPGPPWPGLSRTKIFTLRMTDDILSPAEELLDFVIGSRTELTSRVFFRRDFLIRQEDGDKPAACLYIDELAKVLWLQFAQAVAGELDVRLCSTCGKPFDVRGQTRSDRTFCSNNCKVKHLYHRKSKAKKMRAEGESLREIARATGAPSKTLRENLKTIKRWLGEK